jgi:hypothetical protein
MKERGTGKKEFEIVHVKKILMNLWSELKKSNGR